ncbi:YqaJ viral recombinase family protein [Luteolibacter yonseiensis]|uniref:YqaJ viral recombinase family protein n=1 Tax=Luteolibacter yonseiensis TaxID=1144680 RepID=A0A934R9I7_9BACT|nr:YqaJ viral recombinase family protein [Luteolibacter yonseiensis]MBK1817519.1 YqaJ viral recombinase family protein [Luteolibacter yonseiensis]
MIVHQCVQRSTEWHAARAGKFTASESGPFCAPPFEISLSVPNICDQLDLAGIPHKKNGKRADLLSLLPNPEQYLTLKDGAQSAIDRKLAEWAGEQRNDFQTDDMKRGNALEPIARQQYRTMLGLPCIEVGFISHDSLPIGCSPDDVVLSEDLDEDADPAEIGALMIGGAEIKAPAWHTQIRYLREGVLPDEYLHQVHHCMAVTGADWWDFFSFCPHVTQWTKTRDMWVADYWEAGKIPSFYIRTHRDEFTEQLRQGLEELAAEFLRQKAWLEHLAA